MILCRHKEDDVLWAHTMSGPAWYVAADSPDELHALIREGMEIWFPSARGWWLVDASELGGCG